MLYNSRLAVTAALGLLLTCALSVGIGRADPARCSAAPCPAASAAPVSVHVNNFAYAPPTLTIPVGTTVTFVNDDDPAHTVTAADKSFDSGNMDKGAKWTHTFKTAGTFPYICTYHAFMKATIVVTPAAAPTGS